MIRRTHTISLACCDITVHLLFLILFRFCRLRAAETGRADIDRAAKGSMHSVWAGLVHAALVEIDDDGGIKRRL